MAAPLIAISGGMKSGKSTLAKRLAADYDLPVDSFAAPLKFYTKIMGIAPERAWLQDFGNFITSRENDFFVKRLSFRHPQEQREEFGLIIDDMRRKVCYEWAKANGFLLVRLDIPEAIRIERGAEPDRINDDSETQLNDPNLYWDVIIRDNNTEETADFAYAFIKYAVERRFGVRSFADGGGAVPLLQARESA